MKYVLIVLTVLCCFRFTTFGQSTNKYWENVPKATGWVNDFENIFTAEQEKKLEKLILEYEKKTSIEIVIITIPKNATDVARFDELTLHIAKNWGVGKKDKNNGIVIGLSKSHRRIRINNGLGIEKKLTDKKTGQIIDQIFIPNFKANDYYTGTYDGIQEIIKVLNKK